MATFESGGRPDKAWISRPGVFFCRPWEMPASERATGSVADIIPSLFLSSQVAFSTRCTVSLKGKKRTHEARESCFLTLPHRRWPHLSERSRRSREPPPARSTLRDAWPFGEHFCSLNRASRPPKPSSPTCLLSEDEILSLVSSTKPQSP